MFRPKAVSSLIGSIVLSAVFLMGQAVCIGATPDLDGTWDVSGETNGTMTCPGLDPFPISCTESGTMTITQENTESPADFTYTLTVMQECGDDPVEFETSGAGTVYEDGTLTFTTGSLTGRGCTTPETEFQGVSDGDGCTMDFGASANMECINGCTAVNSNVSAATKADPDCPGGGCMASAAASTVDTSPIHGTSDLAKHLAYFLLPIGAVIGLGIWRRKR
jgi:hypothetical protein